MWKKLAIFGSIFVSLIAIGCGGGGGTSSTGGSLSCGPNFMLPNYASVNDPGDGEPNQLLKWANFPLRVYYPNEEVRTYGGIIYRSNDLADIALNRWKTASNNKATFTQGLGPLDADITLTINNIQSEPGAGGTLGSTQITFFPSSGTIVSAEIIINVWPTMTEAQFTQGMVRTMNHEFGHALFMQGHSDEVTDVMFFLANPNVDLALTSRDINTFLTAYCGEFSTRGVVSHLPGEKPVTISIDCRVGDDH